MKIEPDIVATRCEQYHAIATKQAKHDLRHGHHSEAALHETYAVLLETAAETIRDLLREKTNG